MDATPEAGTNQRMDICDHGRYGILPLSCDSRWPSASRYILLYRVIHRREHLSLPGHHNTPPFRLEVPITITVRSWDPSDPAQQPWGPLHYANVDKELCGDMSRTKCRATPLLPRAYPFHQMWPQRCNLSSEDCMTLSLAHHRNRSLYQ